jgi:hypothetical protein
MGLNDHYSTIRSQVLTMDPLPSINKVYSLVIQEEKQRSVRMPVTPPLEAAALVASFGQQGNDSRGRGRGRGDRIQKKPRCNYCGIPGHIQENCYKLHGYPDKSNSKDKTVEKFAAHSASQRGGCRLISYQISCSSSHT